jgi:hypothetical protein
VGTQCHGVVNGGFLIRIVFRTGDRDFVYNHFRDLWDLRLPSYVYNASVA